MVLTFFLLIIAFINLTLGFLVLLKGFSKQLNRLFFIFCLFTSIWILMNFVTGIQPTLFWLKSAYAFGATIPATAILWIFLLCKEKLTRLKLVIFYGLGFLFFVLSYLNEFIVTDVTKVYLGGYEGKAGTFLPLYSLYVFGTLIFIIYKLFISYHKAKGETKNRVGYVLVGAILWGIIATMVSFILPLFGIMKFIPLDSPSTAIFLIFTTLAITRYHLFEIRVILTELLVGIMGLIWLIFIFLMPTFNLKILTLLTFFLFLIFGYYLVKATHEERKRREEAERIAIRERTLRIGMERLSRARDQFILSTQHYFRTPLTSVIGYLNMILEGSYGQLPEKIKEKIAFTLNSSKELRKRIEEGLAIGAFQVGKAILNLEEAQLESLVKEVIKEIRLQIEEKGLSLKLNFPKIPLPKIKIDKGRMKEVFVNLIDNAQKHTERGEIEIGLKEEKDKNSILFWVKDTGIGIPKEELPFIGTQPFERGKEAKRLSPMGKGIGLYLSNLIVKAHQGKLWAESEGISKGSTFFIELPIK